MFSAAAAFARLAGGREGTEGKEYTGVGAVDITGKDILEVELETRDLEVKVALLTVVVVVDSVEHGAVLLVKAVTWD